MIFEPNELGENVIIRDSYIFAAPILCDVESANGALVVVSQRTVLNEYFCSPLSIQQQNESSSRPTEDDVANYKCNIIKLALAATEPNLFVCP